MSAARQSRPARAQRSVVLDRPDDFAAWRRAARQLLTDQIDPRDVFWSVADAAAAPDLFGGSGPQFAMGAELDGAAPPPSPLCITKPLFALLKAAVLHRDPARFALAYRLLWRLREQPRLHRDAADRDVSALDRLACQVRRDIHKMHAFVRFRSLGEAAGRERFAAWYEPDHHITCAAAPFFRDRFAGMDWLIVTPEASIAWDGEQLREAPGGCREDVPAGDGVEAEWRQYYASIFNPARLKIAAMTREMPRRFWNNLPEADLIPALIREAPQRVAAMVAAPPPASAWRAAPATGLKGRAMCNTLAELNRQLNDTDMPPSDGFSARIVPGEGPAQAAIMLVGEQPGDEEDRQGRPFVGPAGQVLGDALTLAGLDRAQCYVTNAVKRFKFTQRGKRRLHATPGAGDIAHYRWWLNEEIRLVAPRLVVALGGSAVQALTGTKQPISRLRGEAREMADGRPLLVTVHPSYLLRLPDEQGRKIERQRFIRDLQQAATLAS